MILLSAHKIRMLIEKQIKAMLMKIHMKMKTLLETG
jgi:hypothetical protein